MARVSLQLAFVVSALWFVYPKCCESFGQVPIPFVDLALYIPAVLLGAWYWWKGRSFASSWPVIACVLLVWSGLAYAGNSESDRGFLIAALLTIVLPVAALVVEERSWLLCAKTYVIANAAAMAAALWYEMNGDITNPFHVIKRFGFLWARDGVTQTANPNQVGGQLAFAAVIAFIIYLKDHSERRQATEGRFRAGLYLFLTVFLSGGCLLTASRGAAASWLAGMGILAIWGTRSQSAARQKGLVFLATGGLLVLMFGVVASGASPWDGLRRRTESASIFSLGNRMKIWEESYIAWTSNPDFFLRGTGTGMADEVLGAVANDGIADDYGVLRKNCHNSFVEWVLSFGILGIICGTALAATAVYRALLLDHGEGNVSRLAILATAAVFAVTAVSYRHSCWLATGSLMLAMVSGTPISRRIPGTGTSGEQVSAGVPRPHSGRNERSRPRGPVRRLAFDSAARAPHDGTKDRESGTSDE